MTDSKGKREKSVPVSICRFVRYIGFCNPTGRDGFLTQDGHLWHIGNKENTDVPLGSVSPETESRESATP